MKMNKLQTQSSVTEVFKLLQDHPFVSTERWESQRKDIMLEIVAWRWKKVFIIATMSFTRLTLGAVSLMTYQLHCMVKISVNINPDDDDDNWHGVRQLDVMLKCDTTVVFVIRSERGLHTLVKNVWREPWQHVTEDERGEKFTSKPSSVCVESREIWDEKLLSIFQFSSMWIFQLSRPCRTLHWQLNEDDHQFASSLMLINEGNECWKINYAREREKVGLFGVVCGEPIHPILCLFLIQFIYINN